MTKAAVIAAVASAAGQLPLRPDACGRDDATADGRSRPPTLRRKLQIARDAISATSRRQVCLAQRLRRADGTGSRWPPKPARPFVVQQLALATYKAGEEDAKAGGPEKALAGYQEAEILLKQLDVDTTTDPETLGLWSALQKRHAEIEAAPRQLRRSMSRKGFGRPSAVS